MTPKKSKNNKRTVPRFVLPMAALRAQHLPEGPEWLYEVKFDGYRVLIIKDDDLVRLVSRNEKDLSKTYPSIQVAGRRLTASSAVVDGELVALDPNGVPSFQALQHRKQTSHQIAYYAFDLLHLNGKDLLQTPLRERRELLLSVIAESGLLLSEILPGAASEIAKAVKGVGLEGVIAKRRESLYESGERSGDWVKVRFDLAQEFVVGGYRAGNNGVDALLVGFYEGKRLRFAGKVRAGFIPHTRRELAAALKGLHTDKCPFPDLPDRKPSRWGMGVTTEDMAEMQWTRPQLVVQIKFLEWTEDSRLRHASFMGIRTDRAPRDVRKDQP
jgi:DNA ligase D-like protein (predicted ligase)